MASKFKNKSRIGGLLVTRNVGSGVIINNGEILIEIVDICGKEVRVAIKAHDDIKIDRIENFLLSEKIP